MAGAIPGPAQQFTVESALTLLASGTMEVHGLLARSSNYTLLVTIKHNDAQALAVYKPRSGERPLWDFPGGTLAQREVAAFAVSEALGWKIVPPTIVRDGPHGPGMVQLYIYADPRENYFTLRQEFAEQFLRMALFDAVINNADRKGGHCLKDQDGHIWGIDHGVCFHEENKLRTVIWQFAGASAPANLLRDLRRFQERLASPSHPAAEALRTLLTDREIAALNRRTGHLVQDQRLPSPKPYERYTPWPPI